MMMKWMVGIIAAALLIIACGFVIMVMKDDDDTKYKIHWENKLILDPEDQNEPVERVKDAIDHAVTVSAIIS